MQTFQLTLTESDLSVIGEALSMMQYRVAAPLISKINSQINPKQEESDASP
jgi:hypothetical protein